MRSIPCLALTVALAFGVACDSSEDSTSEVDQLRHIHFDAVEVNETLDSEPDLTFLVDVREGNVVTFDQSEESFDWSAFMAICPSMAAPIPMTDYMASLELEVDHLDSWLIMSERTDAVAFRDDSLLDELFEDNCWYVLRCDPWGGDCVWVCE